MDMCRSDNIQNRSTNYNVEIPVEEQIGMTRMVSERVIEIIASKIAEDLFLIHKDTIIQEISREAIIKTTRVQLGCRIKCLITKILPEKHLISLSLDRRNYLSQLAKKKKERGRGRWKKEIR